MTTGAGQGGVGQGRRAARRYAMMVLYQHDVLGGDDLAAAVARFESEHGIELPEYSRHIVDGVLAERERVDEAIERHLEEWRLDRLGAVERSILRISAWELATDAVPAEVSIDEAVELSKRYASPEAARLVNGVLGAMVRGAEQG